MYSGSTLTKYSGRLIGTHQKIDRVARRHIAQLLDDNTTFPKARQILAFEGNNGPDAIKRKSPAHNEPWHYFNPFDDNDTELIGIISDHYYALVLQLGANNTERAAFEAAWLAHAIVDGLTPAHHYPYEVKLAELSQGQVLLDRTTLKKKLIMPGSSHRQTISNNWKAWGPRGLRTAHGLFEMGVASLLAPLSMSEAAPTQAEIRKIKKVGLPVYFKQIAREVAVLDMYGNYCEKGWTPKLASQVRHKLGPLLVRTVTLAWYAAAKEAQE